MNQERAAIMERAREKRRSREAKHAATKPRLQFRRPAAWGSQITGAAILVVRNFLRWVNQRTPK